MSDTYELSAGNKPDAKSMFNAMSKPTGKISDVLNKKLEVQYIYSTQIELPDLNTGEIFTAPKIYIFTTDGKVYTGVSSTLYRSLKDFVGFFGEDFKPSTIKVSKEQSNGKQFYQVEVI